MKKLVLGLTATAVLSFGIFAFMGCEKEENKVKMDNPPQTSLVFLNETRLIIDEESNLIANYHDECLRNFFTIFNINDNLTNVTFAHLFNSITQTKENHPEHWQNISTFEIDTNAIINMVVLPAFFPTEIIQSLVPDSFDIQMKFNAEQIEIICNLITETIPILLQNSISETDFYEQYNNWVNEIIPVNNIYDYIYIRFYANVAISSYITWIDLLKPIEYLQKEQSRWDKVKYYANAVAKETKILLKEDAVGAAVGAAAAATVAIPAATFSSPATGGLSWVAAGKLIGDAALTTGAATSLFKGVELIRSKRQ